MPPAAPVRRRLLSLFASFAGSPFPCSDAPDTWPNWTHSKTYSMEEDDQAQASPCIVKPWISVLDLGRATPEKLLKTPNVQWQVIPRHEASGSLTPRRPAQARSWHGSSVPPHPIRRADPK